jgi:hypothetical protein
MRVVGYQAQADAISDDLPHPIFVHHDLHWLHTVDNGIVKGTGKEIAIALAKNNFGGNRGDPFQE